MNLTKFENEVKMTSLDIAEITGKQHKHIMRDIRQEIEKIGYITEPIFGLSEYKDVTGRKLPCYEFGKDGAMQLALKYDAVVRYKVIKKIEELENNQPKIPNFNNPAEAARAWADQFEQAEKQKQINLQNKPKVEFYDTVTKSDDMVDMSTVAKIINIKGFGRNKLFAFLRDKGVLRDNNEPYQYYVDRGYFKIVESDYQTKHSSVKVSCKTVVTQKGLDFIIREVNIVYAQIVPKGESHGCYKKSSYKNN